MEKNGKNEENVVEEWIKERGSSASQNEAWIFLK
jgi:hypothetical protein